MGREDGTASVEAIAAVPFLLLAVLAAVQIGVVGQSLWSAAIAARAGARAALVGGEAAATARRAVPRSMRHGSRISIDDGVSVQVPVPRLLPLVPHLTVEAETRLDGGDE